MSGDHCGRVAVWSSHPATPRYADDRSGSRFQQEFIDARNGLVSVQSRAASRETADKLLVALASESSLSLLASIMPPVRLLSDYSCVRPNLLIFGNPQGGTVLMLDQQLAGIDLPLKALIWEDAAGKVWLTYNDPAWIAQRHSFTAASAQAVKAMAATLDAIAQEATTPTQ